MGNEAQIGSCSVGQRVGTGGMGAVWRGRHRRTGTEVAIKVMTDEHAREPSYLEAFHREIRALARLHHPNIARLVDFGTVTDEEASGEERAWRAGTPWMAVEFIDGRPLSELDPPTDWDWVEQLVQSLLGGLAHAHARQIIHRDLKLANVMTDGAEGVPAATRLVDFGLAEVYKHLHEEASEGESDSSDRYVVGTPRYMAPEQIRGSGRDQGPWTDLYAVGCLVWRLVCREPPYDGESVDEILRSHLEGNRVEFRPQMPVPAGLEAWLQSLLVSMPEHRIQRAAEASHRLAQLGPPTLAPGKASLGGRSPSDPTGRTLRLIESAGPSPRSRPSAGAARRGRQGPTRAVPADWRPEGPSEEWAIPPAGVKLFGLRELPMVGRETLREQMWQRLVQVDQTGEPRALFLEGPTGIGKSRLAGWLTRRVDELGVGSSLRVNFLPRMGSGEGFGGMIRRLFRAEGLSREDFYERLTDREPPFGGRGGLSESDLRGLTELAFPTDGEVEPAPTFRFSSPCQVYSLLGRLFELVRRSGPLVVWLDDLQWGLDGVELIEHILERPGERPILLVGTHRAGESVDQQEVAGRIAEICAGAAGESIALGGLAPADHRRLIAEQIDLPDETVDLIAEMTDGDPLFARELLGCWAEQGVLTGESNEVTVTPGALTAIPEDIEGLWMTRVEGLLATFEGEERRQASRALEAAVALGPEVDRREWEAVLARLAIEPPEGLWRRVVDRGWAEPTRCGWRLGHRHFEETLERLARREGRWHRYHRACAKMIDEEYADEPRARPGRRAAHRLAAGEPEAALEPLLEEAYLYDRRGAYARMVRRLELRSVLLDRIGAADDDPRRLENRLERQRPRIRNGEFDRAADALEEVLARAEASDLPELRAKAGEMLGRTHFEAGRLVEARRMLGRAIEWAGEAGSATLEGRACNTMVDVELRVGELSRAEEYVRRAADLLEGREYLQALERRATLTLYQGEHEEAGELFDDLTERARGRGDRLIEAHALNYLGELARAAGRWEEAREKYQVFRQINLSFGNRVEVAIADLNLAQVGLGERAWSTGEDHLEEAHRELEQLGIVEHFAAILELIALVVAVGRGQWAAVDRLVEGISGRWEGEEPLEPDHPQLLGMAGAEAERRGELERAADFRRLAIELWRQLGNTDEAEALESKLEDVDR